MAVRGSGSALHRQSHRGNGRERDGSPYRANGTDAIGAADGFTAGLLGTLYQLKQKERFIKGLDAEDLAEMLDSALQAAATSVDGTLTALSKYF
jgi:hypothetical protein